MLSDLAVFLLECYRWGLFAFILSSWFDHELAFKLRESLGPLYEKPLLAIRGKLAQLGLSPNIDISPIFLFIGVGIGQRVLEIL
jgi:uncharacterized protein YggT (Ycf19 family)